LPDEEKSDLDPVLQSWQKQRQDSRSEMLEYLDSENYSNFKRKFNIFLKTPGAGVRKMRKGIPVPGKVKELAPVLIYERLAVVRSFDPYIENAPFDLLHALRLEIKKLRYTVEYFREVLGPESEGLINQFKQLQDHLGDLVDAQVSIELLGKILDKKASKKEELPKEVIKSYLEYKTEERDQLISSFPESWSELNSPEFRRNLALAVSTL
jgi:CHAD domain-containing protein